MSELGCKNKLLIQQKVMSQLEHNRQLVVYSEQLQVIFLSRNILFLSVLLCYASLTCVCNSNSQTVIISLVSTTVHR